MRQSALVVAVVVAVGATLTPVTAQTAGPPTVPLDTGSERIAGVEIDGTTYAVYRIHNRIPYASGVEVRADGRWVTERSEVEPVFARLAARRTLHGVNTSVSPATITSRSAAEEQFITVAWAMAATELTSEDVRRLAEVERTARGIDSLVSPPLAAIDSVLNLFERMRETTVLGTSVWDVATMAYPQLPEYETALSEVAAELREWNAAAEQVTGNVEPAMASIESIRRGEDVDHERVAERLEAATAGLERLATKSEEVESGLVAVSDNTGEAAARLREVRVPESVTRQLSELAHGLDDVASEVDSFGAALEAGQSQLDGVRETAEDERHRLLRQWESEQSALWSQWRARQSAQTRVYGTIGGSGAGLAVLVLLARSRF